MEERKVPGKNELRKREPVIQVKNLYKVYRVGETKVYALNGVDFTMYRGEFCAIVGTSGSGKSTLLNMLGGLDIPTSGEIKIQGKKLSDLNDEQLTIFRRRNIGFIFQNYNLLPMLNVYENIVLPIELDGQEVDQVFLNEIINMLGLKEKLKSMPNMLSGGQQQRVAIARALINRPEVLLADEPTGNLDSQNADEIMRLLEEINRMGTTVVVVTHSEEIVARMHKRVITMERGCVISDEIRGGESDEN